MDNEVTAHAKVCPPGLLDVSEVPPHAIVPVVAGSPYGGKRRMELDLRIAELEEGIDVALIEGVYEAAMALDVLANHALSLIRMTNSIGRLLGNAADRCRIAR